MFFTSVAKDAKSGLPQVQAEKNAEQGGMIQLLPENDRARFAINANAASKAKIKISSGLLSLARVVVGNGK
jgi:hypothetical protein